MPVEEEERPGPHLLPRVLGVADDGGPVLGPDRPTRRAFRGSISSFDMQSRSACLPSQKKKEKIMSLFSPSPFSSFKPGKRSTDVTSELTRRSLGLARDAAGSSHASNSDARIAISSGPDVRNRSWFAL
jgi:hypothetical protein